MSLFLNFREPIELGPGSLPPTILYLRAGITEPQLFARLLFFRLFAPPSLVPPSRTDAVCAAEQRVPYMNMTVVKYGGGEEQIRMWVVARGGGREGRAKSQRERGRAVQKQHGRKRGSYGYGMRGGRRGRAV